MRYLPFLSTTVTLIFTASVFLRYLSRKRTYLLLWSIGLLFYGLGTFSEIVLGFTFNEGILKLWYLTGAMLTAAWLGQGTISLLVRKKNVAPAITLVLTIVSIYSAYLVWQAPITSAAAGYQVAEPASIQYQEILVREGTPIILLTILLNIYGTITLVGGALYSTYIFWRKRVLENRMYGNILIAAGALMPALGGTFTKAGLPDWLYVSELLGAILMFLGFLKATQAQESPELSTAAPSAAD
jgi:hypothetical protein